MHNTSPWNASQATDTVKPVPLQESMDETLAHDLNEKMENAQDQHDYCFIDSEGKDLAPVGRSKADEVADLALALRLQAQEEAASRLEQEQEATEHDKCPWNASQATDTIKPVPLQEIMDETLAHGLNESAQDQQDEGFVDLEGKDLAPVDEVADLALALRLQAQEEAASRLEQEQESKCPWNVSLPKETLKPVRLQEIMDETLAHDLNEKLENARDQQDYGFIDSEEGKDAAPAATSKADEDADLALALQLQAHEEAQYRLNQQQRPSAGANSHIVFQSRQDPYIAELHRSAVYNPAHFQDDEEVVEEAAASGDPDIVRGDWKKDNEGNIISKHDLEICGRKNATNLEKYHQFILEDDIVLPNKTFNALKENVRKDKVKGIHVAGRVEGAKRATTDSVLDEKTRQILWKLTNRGDLEHVGGIIRQGKEATVFEAFHCPEGTLRPQVCAVKVFRTTLTAFRNRSEYIIGDARHDQNYAKKSLLRQTRIWTEREFSNLHRAHQAGLLTPLPYCFKDHVLVMSFVGTEKAAAPQLRQVTLSFSLLKAAYVSILASLRQLYQVGRLVHADLSPYNLLYHEKQVHWIDFGQAMEISHPSALEYLKRDIHTITTYFQQEIEAREYDNSILVTEPQVLDLVTSSLADLEPLVEGNLLKKVLAIPFRPYGKAIKRIQVPPESPVELEDDGFN